MVNRYLFKGVGPVIGLWVCGAAQAQAQAQAPVPAVPQPVVAPVAQPTPGTGPGDASSAVTSAPLAPAAVSAPAATSEEAALEARFRALVGRPSGITAEQVAAKAVASSWSVRSKGQDILIAESTVAKARSAYLPDVTLSASYTRFSSIQPGSLGGGGSLVGVGDGPVGVIDPATPLFRVPSFSFPVLLNQYSLQAGAVLPVSDYLLRMGQGLAAARHNQEAASLNERAARLGVAADARIAYYDWVRIRMAQVVSEQTVAQSREHLKNTRLIFENGRASKADVLRAESQLSSVTLMLSQAEHQARLAEHRVRTLMHEGSATPLEIGEDVLNTSAPKHPIYTLEGLYAEAVQKRLEVKALGESAKSLRSTGNAVKADQYPRLSVFGNVYYANPNNRVIPQRDKFDATWDLGVRLTWTPTKIPGTRAEARSYESQAAQREADLGAFKDALRTELMQAYQALSEAELDIVTAKQGLDSAEEGYRVRKQMFQYGRATTVDLTDAETDLLRARLAMVNARIALLSAGVRLEHSTGRDVR